MRTAVLRWAPAILVMAIIFFASGTPGADIPSLGIWDLFFKKGGHMVGYGLLALAYFHGLTNGRKVKLSHFPAAFVLACLFAASDEFHQSFTPGRSPSIQDVCIDAVGASISLIFLFTIRRRSKEQQADS